MNKQKIAKRIETMENDQMWRVALIVLLVFFAFGLFYAMPLLSIILIVLIIWNAVRYSQESQKIKDMKWELE